MSRPERRDSRATLADEEGSSKTVIETPPDPYEEFMRLPLGQESDDPRVDVRRARLEDFEQIYDCVDAAFGTVRPHALYDWLYVRNPFGTARVWIVVEKTTQQVLKTGAFYPWPIWRGSEPLMGSLSGDAATLPEWQRKGLSRVRRIVRRSHPWSGKIASIAGPNQGSIIVSRKAGEGNSILGALTGGVAILRGGPVLEKAGLPSWLASPAGALANGLFSSWRSVALRKASSAAGRVETVGRFTTDYDDVTERTMAFPAYWSPHNAEFLNWRYLDHPTEQYVGFALVENERPVAYSVLRIDGSEATLSEFAADTLPGDGAVKLLDATLQAAREAGCAYVTFFGTPVWRHWGLFRRAGLLPYKTKNYLDATYKVDEKNSQKIENWQLTPGDRDYH